MLVYSDSSQNKLVIHDESLLYEWKKTYRLYRNSLEHRIVSDEYG